MQGGLPVDTKGCEVETAILESMLCLTATEGSPPSCARAKERARAAKACRGSPARSRGSCPRAMSPRKGPRVAHGAPSRKVDGQPTIQCVISHDRLGLMPAPATVDREIDLFLPQVTQGR